jgi:hypothetical protein
MVKSELEHSLFMSDIGSYFNHLRSRRRQPRPMLQPLHRSAQKRHGIDSRPEEIVTGVTFSALCRRPQRLGHPLSIL